MFTGSPNIQSGKVICLRAFPITLMTFGSCLPLLRRHAKRDELVEALIRAGEATWTRGAHEVREFRTLVHNSNVSP